MCDISNETSRAGDLDPTDFCKFHPLGLIFRISEIELRMRERRLLAHGRIPQRFLNASGRGLDYDAIEKRINECRWEQGRTHPEATQLVFENIGFVFSSSNRVPVEHQTRAIDQMDDDAGHMVAEHHENHQGPNNPPISSFVAINESDSSRKTDRTPDSSSSKGITSQTTHAVASAAAIEHVSKPEDQQELQEQAPHPLHDKPTPTSPQPTAQSDKRSTRLAVRVQPGESTKRQARQTPGCRFCWDVGAWIREVIGGGAPGAYTAYEEAAAGLLMVPQTDNGLHEDEKAVLRDPSFHKMNFQLLCNKYRAVRARLIIGFACIYEHNQRGNGLNKQRAVHPACKPSQEDFRYISMKKTQAQQICVGVDANQVSKFMTACHAGRILPPLNISNSNRNVLVANSELEHFFPSQLRKGLYARLHVWYDEKCAKPEVRFAIQPEYSEYSIQPPFLPYAAAGLTEIASSDSDSEASSNGLQGQSARRDGNSSSRKVSRTRSKRSRSDAALSEE